MLVMQPVNSTSESMSESTRSTIEWILRIGVFCCFVGHGAFGIITKEAWVPYFALVGIGRDAAFVLMPLVGLMDIVVLGTTALVFPLRALLAWGAFWTIWTALLRPFTGEGWWEFLERGGNYGVTLAFVLLAGLPKTLKPWFFERARVELLPERLMPTLWVLRIATGALMIGHGAFGLLMQKKSWFGYLAVLGLDENTVRSLNLLSLVGAFEMLVGVAVLLFPVVPLLWFIVVWKVATELLRPLAGEPFWEFIERFGSYTVPLTLIFLTQWQQQQAQARATSEAVGSAGASVV
jgi:hypothetical protein